MIAMKASVGAGNRISGCRGCGEVFAGLGLFDKHQSWGQGEDGQLHLTCLDPATLGMEKNAQGRWFIPRPEGAPNWWE
jgi:hypothetical protein